ncbi:MAG: hypothetical protein ABUS57_05610 [Pseudomonadota bacterium]
MRWLALVSLWVLTACSPKPTTTPDAEWGPILTTTTMTATTTTSASTTAAVNQWSDYRWRAWSDQSGASLTLIPDESDAAAIEFECVRNSGRVRVTTAADTDKGRMTFTSGDVRLVLPAYDLPEDEIFSERAGAEMRVDEPLLEAFKKSGDLAVFDPPSRLRHAGPDELDVIQDFFAKCAS